MLHDYRHCVRCVMNKTTLSVVLLLLLHCVVGAHHDDDISYLNVSPHVEYRDESTTRAALIDMYTLLHGDNWLINTNWNSAHPPCSWHGVTCDVNNNVTAIVLRENLLSGVLPRSAAFLQLVHIQQIILSGNNISGDLPSEWSMLTELQDIDLGMCVVPALCYIQARMF